MKVFTLAKSGGARVIFAGDIVIADGMTPGATTMVHQYGVGYEVEGSLEDVLLELVGAKISDDDEPEPAADQPAADQPAADQPAADQPAADPAPQS
jgi:hypothetical protein